MPSIHPYILLVLILGLPSCHSASLPVLPASLSTTLGQVTGLRKILPNSQEIDVFYGIPFAKPPVGDLRFRAPLPIEPWIDARDATKKPDSCWQSVDTSFDKFPGVDMWNPITPMSEDCLYLNIWHPRSRSSTPRAILVWIYGGSFNSGSTTLNVYDGTELALKNDVILVSIAYRLGPFGFLYLGTEDAPGNVGLLDQVLALKWVKDNAVNLGGSPDHITIFGESAGAVSVGFHLLSPLSRDLFTYAIMESASPVAKWAVQDRFLAENRAVKLAERISCSTSSSEDIANCLRSIMPQVLSNKQWELPTSYFDLTLGPVVDGYFLNDFPLNLIKRGDVKNTSILVGVNKNEGIYFDIYGFNKYFPLDGDGQLTEGTFEEILSKILKDKPQIAEQVRELYQKNSNLTYAEIVDAVSGDTLFKCPIVDFARLYSQKGNPVFMYSFEHRVSTNTWPEWTGTAHGYEIEIVFGLPLAPDSVYTDEEKVLSTHVMELWTQFARIGNPNPDAASNVWPQYNTDSEDYVVIDTDGIRVDHYMRHHECTFWANVSKTQQTEPSQKITSERPRATIDSDKRFTEEAFRVFSR